MEYDSVLVNKASEKDYYTARDELEPVRDELLKKAAAIVDSYITSLKPKNKKAELAELQKMGICEQDYRSYLQRRKAASPGQVSYGLRNPAWLLKQAEAAGKGGELEALMAKAKALSANVDAAKKKIIRKKFK